VYVRLMFVEQSIPGLSQRAPDLTPLVVQYKRQI
jgi:hypothetical protein